MTFISKGDAQVEEEHQTHLRARAQGVEHVEEDEAGEGHGSVSRCDHVVLQLRSTDASPSCGQASFGQLLTSLQKTKSVPHTMMKADTSTLRMRLRVMMLSFTLRGGFLITSLSTGSTPKLKTTRQQRKADTFKLRSKKTSKTKTFKVTQVKTHSVA